MLMRLLGAVFPKTDAGTIAGKPESATEEAATPLPAISMNSLRDISLFLRLCFMQRSSMRRPQPGSRFKAQSLCLLLRLQHQFHGQEAVRLRHGGFRTVNNVRHKLFAVRQRVVCGIYVPGLFLFHQKKVTASRSSRDVNVLADFNKSVCAQNGQPAIAPGGKTIWSEPVHADVSSAAVASQHQIAKILELRILLVVHIAHLRRDDLSLGRAGKK